MEATDYPRLLTHALRAATTTKAIGVDGRIVCILDAEKHFEEKAFHQALHAVVCDLPERVKFILGVRTADPIMESDLREAGCVLCDRDPDASDPLVLFWPLGDISDEEAEKLARERLGEKATPEVLQAIRDRCGRLALAVDAGIRIVELLGAAALVTLQGLPPRNAAQAARNCMTTLADHALKATAPGPDLVKLLALAREPLCRSDLAEALKYLGRTHAPGDLVTPLASLAVGNCLRRVVVDETECYEPYHDWMREALRQGMGGDPQEVALGERALGRMYANRLTGDEPPRNAVQLAPYHLRRGPLQRAEDQRWFVAVVTATQDQKQTWGMMHDVRDELERAAEVVDGSPAQYDARDRAIVHNGLGAALLLMGEAAQALGRFERVRDLAGKLQAGSGDDVLAVALGNMGIIHGDHGRLEEALQCQQQAYAIDQRLGNPRGQAEDLGNMGIIQRLQGRLEEAMECQQQAHKIDQRLGNAQGQAEDLGNMGAIYADQGRLEEALHCYQQAYEIAECLGDPLTMANQLCNMGLVYAEQGQTDKALEYLRRALELYDSHGLRTEGRDNTARNIEELTTGSQGS